MSDIQLPAPDTYLIVGERRVNDTNLPIGNDNGTFVIVGDGNVVLNPPGTVAVPGSSIVGTATTKNEPGVSLTFVGTTVMPNQYTGTMPFSPTDTFQLDSWQLTFKSGSTTGTAETSDDHGAEPPPPPLAVPQISPTIHGSPTIPGSSFDLAITAKFDGSVQGAFFDIIDLDAQPVAPNTPDIISATPEAVNDGEAIFQSVKNNLAPLSLSHHYVLDLYGVVSRDGLQPTGNNDVKAWSETFYDIVPKGNDVSLIQEKPGAQVTDTSTGGSSTVALRPYSGPVSGIGGEYINVTPDNTNVAAVVPNSFIHTGTGNDAIDVSKVSGNNVLDGGGGSNFLVGGAGSDTFFIDDRNPTADIWSTISNFHSGDNATVWGVDKADFTITYLDGLGAAGETGLTVRVTAPNKPNASVTLAGYTTADVKDGKLAISFGTTAADPTTNTPGGNYMLIHAT